MLSSGHLSSLLKMTVDKPESDLPLVSFKTWKTEKLYHALPTGLYVTVVHVLILWVIVSQLVVT